MEASLHAVTTAGTLLESDLGPAVLALLKDLNDNVATAMRAFLAYKSGAPFGEFIVKEALREILKQEGVAGIMGLAGQDGDGDDLPMAGLLETLGALDGVQILGVGFEPDNAQNPTSEEGYHRDIPIEDGTES